MKQKRPHYFPLIILSFSLACSGLGTRSAHSSDSFVRGHASQKQAVISEVASFDSPAVKSHFHPSMLFSYEAPVDWTLHNTNSGVALDSPNGIVLSISVTHAGYRLSSMSFLNLASNTETTNYMGREDYTEIFREEDRPGRFVFVEKTYIQDGIRELAMSIYRQVGESMYIVEMTGDWVLITASPKYEAIFSAFNESIRGQPSPKEESPAYTTSWKYVAMDDDYSMDVPVGWNVTTDQSPGLIHTRFNSPDGNAAIESFLLEEQYGRLVTPKLAAQYALKLIEASFAKGSDDIRVTSEVNLGERISGKITWLSRAGGYAGETYFEVRSKTQIFILTRAWNRFFEDIYAPVVDTAVLSFKPGPSIR